MTAVPGQIDHIIVRRFLRMYSSWWTTSLYAGMSKANFNKVEPISTFLSESKRPDNKKWHFGRVKHFLDRLSRGDVLEPIVIDNECGGGHIYPIPILIDGHHRTVASKIFGCKTIPASYSGRIDLLEYLTGTRARAPLD